MSLKKQYLKSKNTCKVTFTLPKNEAENAGNVSLLGDFNNWDANANPMKSSKKGDYSVSLNLESGKEYQFRYLVDGNVWLNENEADKLVPAPFGVENSLISL
ncbi:MAG: isoamylase early set domain-containing protein [Chitinophagales bacterium]|nr:isoamylase early set domain-containing protein [Bacteroidota bacterium]MCB9044427.1 isoamylase early set domain-containing protein [Chitinophagales bacterium]